jgi:hypothetical protein
MQKLLCSHHTSGHACTGSRALHTHAHTCMHARTLPQEESHLHVRKHSVKHHTLTLLQPLCVCDELVHCVEVGADVSTLQHNNTQQGANSSATTAAGSAALVSSDSSWTARKLHADLKEFNTCSTLRSCEPTTLCCCCCCCTVIHQLLHTRHCCGMLLLQPRRLLPSAIPRQPGHLRGAVRQLAQQTSTAARKTALLLPYIAICHTTVPPMLQSTYHLNISQCNLRCCTQQTSNVCTKRRRLYCQM